MYKGIKEAVLSGETRPLSCGKRIILPSSFTGGPRYMIQNYQDAMAICKVVGYPDLFITFTCNPKWPELEDFLKNRELNAEDRPDMICKAFKVKLDHLIKDIKTNKIFGRVCADKIISAEIPDKHQDPEYYEAVEKHMMRGPCGTLRKESPCMENGKCICYFPKRFVDTTTIDDDGYPIYRRRDDNKIINKSGVDLDNRYVVPHNRSLLLKYGAHINVEWCNQSRSIKYLFKYVNKGNDRVTASFYRSDTEDHEDDKIDEVSMYYDCRYISPCEAAWRIFGYNLHYRDSSVVRIFFVPPGSGEVYYLRLLLNFAKGPTCYEDIRTVDGILYPTFRDACYARGLLDDDREYIDAIEEVSHWSSGIFLRKLFVTLLFSNSMERSEHVWENTWSLLSDDILHRQRTLLDNPDLHLTDEELKELTLIDVENIMNSYNRSLKDFPTMPFPNMDTCSLQLMASGTNRLICDELRYDRRRLAEEHATYLQQLTDEQKVVYKEIMLAVHSRKGGVFFLYGYGGTGKTFVWKTLASALRSKGEIVLTVASSGIASLLLPGGRIAHSRFAIPLNLDEYSTCNIKQGSHLAELLIKSKLIIWDEAPMVNKHCIEALDRTMRDILRFRNSNSLNEPFGGKTIVFEGDFRQILPVIPKDWILDIGDGRCGTSNDRVDSVKIPDDILINDWDDPIVAICKATYPEMFTGLNGEYRAEDRAILAPTLQIVDEINQYMMSLNPVETITYYSSDKACPIEANNDLLASIHTPEFLNTIKCSGVLNHELTVKVGTPIMLLRNIDHSVRLCNGTRLVITKLGKHIIEARSIAGRNSGQKVFVPRMTLSPSDHRIPFRFQRRQFPIMVSYAMTINKSQGQSLSKVGLILKKPVFTHGQLYVTLSRVTHKKGLKVLLCHEEGDNKETDNVVFKEVFKYVA
ncbi:hypothetical protein AAHE18_03G189500 [Arachis hypogaea]